MSTPIVQFDHGEDGIAAKNIGVGALALYLAISLPLVIFTFVVWGIMLFREKRSDRKEKEKLSNECAVA